MTPDVLPVDTRSGLRTVGKSTRHPTNALGNDDPEAKLALHLTLSIAARDEVKRLLGKFDGLTR
jgi:hypothetical protein